MYDQSLFFYRVERPKYLKPFHWLTVCVKARLEPMRSCLGKRDKYGYGVFLREILCCDQNSPCTRFFIC